ncbi:MAG: TatD family hydrolase [Candidatus Omnitrophica bacterium]|nr:TatD family hydrolase [Candidatus Omnitrophota bacterium]MCM8810716.1 TatD family hydrolase [Candidatus Omnitrophota bacterium]MCM8833342.1 TatD family hydrolase [Candidatus Omnitrophota bacterium]
MKYFDTHCHLDFEQFDNDREEVIKMAKKQGVEYIINVGINLESCRKVIEISEKYDFIFASIGIHPLDVSKYKLDDLKKIEEFTKNKKVVAIGETGLDFYYSKENKEKQKDFFINQIEIAKKYNLPLVIHQRESKNEMIEIIEKIKLPEKVVFHCFGGDLDFAQYCLKKNFFISFTGNLTFKNAKNVKDVAKFYPIEKVMVETDAPFLAPDPFRGKRNEPFMIKYIVEEIAKIKEKDKNEITKIIFDNSIFFFNIKQQ